MTPVIIILVIAILIIGGNYQAHKGDNFEYLQDLIEKDEEKQKAA